MTPTALFAVFTGWAVLSTATDVVPDSGSWKGIVLIIALQILREVKAWIDKREVKQALAVETGKTAKETTAIKDTMAEIKDQTNGRLDREKAMAEAYRRQAEEMAGIMGELVAKVKKAAAGEKFDPAATVVKKAEELIEKKKQAGDSQAMPVPLPNHPN